VAIIPQLRDLLPAPVEYWYCAGFGILIVAARVGLYLLHELFFNSLETKTEAAGF
jgi:hypothetical protein